MELQLDGEFYITSDPNNYCVSKKKKAKQKDGSYKDFWEHLTFHRTLEDAVLSYYTETKLKKARVRTLEGYVKKVQEAKKEIKAIVEKGFAL